MVIKRDKTGNIPKEDRIYYRWEDEVFTRAAEIEFEYLTTFKDISETGTSRIYRGHAASLVVGLKPILSWSTS